MATILRGQTTAHPSWILIRTMTKSSLRSSQADAGSVVVRALVIIGNGAIAAFVSLFLLAFLFGLEDDLVRGRLLTALCCTVALGWTFLQVVFQQPANLLLDLRPIRELPLGFAKLWRLRLAASLIGWWAVVLGPAVVYIVLIRSANVGDAVITVIAIALSVLIQAQIGSILLVQRDRILNGFLGSAAMLIGMIAFYLVLMQVILVGLEETSISELLDQVQRSPLVGVAAFTPPGLLAGIVNGDGTVAANLASLAGLTAACLFLGIVDRHLLKRDWFRLPSAQTPATHRTIPLALLLRRLRTLSAGTCLTLVELESAARNRGLRWCLMIAVAFLVAGSLDPTTGTTAPLVVSCILLSSHRAERTLPTVRLWTESFALPLPLLDALRAAGRAPLLVLFLLLGAGASFNLLRFDFPGWPPLLLALAFCSAVILLADGGFGWYDCRWQIPPGATGKDRRYGKQIAQGALSLGILLLFFVFLILYLWYFEDREGSTVASVAIGSVLLLAGLAGRAIFLRRQRLLLQHRGRELLLGDTPAQADAAHTAASPAS